MKKILKITGYLVLALILVAIIVNIVNFLKEKKRISEENKVILSVDYNLENCTKEFPLFLVISNNSQKTIYRTTFGFNITRIGYSNNLIDYDYNYISNDKIILPNSQFSTCYNYKLEPQYKIFDNPKNLKFEVVKKYVFFQD